MAQAGLKELKLELFLRLRNSGELVWKTRDGSEVALSEMSDQHLVNAIRMLERNSKEDDEEEFWAVNSDLVGLDMSDIS